MYKQFGWLFIVLALILQMIGGFMDITKKNELVMSKEHVFADAFFLLVFGFGLLSLDMVRSKTK